jgi:hypothetical protein
MKLRIVAAVVIAALHFALTIYAYGQADASEPTDASRAWGKGMVVLAVPILYAFAVAETRVAIPQIAGLDWLPFVMLLNSLFWGAAIVTVVAWAKRRRALRSSGGTAQT